jgi:hypothetical protein
LLIDVLIDVDVNVSFAFYAAACRVWAARRRPEGIQRCRAEKERSFYFSL